MQKAASALAYEILDLGTLQGNDNFVHGINNAGIRVGSVFNPSTGSIEAFVARDGQRELLGTLGGSFSAAFSINNVGTVVGGSLSEDDETFHAFIRNDGTLVDLNDALPADSQWELSQALGINDRGQVLGFGNFKGQLHMFLLVPRDEAARPGAERS